MLQTVLLGVAAHTMTPILGQGLKCGLQNVAVLAQTLEQHQCLETAPPAYNQTLSFEGCMLPSSSES